jgi:hypothetical protein
MYYTSLVRIGLQRSAGLEGSSSWWQLRLLRFIFEKINIIFASRYQLTKIEPYAPADVSSVSVVIESTAMVRDIAEAGARANWTMVLEELRLDRETDSELATLNTTTHMPEHHVVRVTHQSSQKRYDERS